MYEKSQCVKKENMSLTEFITGIIKNEDKFDKLDTGRDVMDAIRSGKLILEIPMIMAPVSSLQENENTAFDPVENVELMNSMATKGLLEPLAIIGPMDNGKYLVLDGNRRLAAIRRMKDQFWTTPKADTQKRISCRLLGDKNAPKVVKSIISVIKNA